MSAFLLTQGVLCVYFVHGHIHHAPLAQVVPVYGIAVHRPNLVAPSA